MHILGYFPPPVHFDGYITHQVYCG